MHAKSREPTSASVENRVVLRITGMRERYAGVRACARGDEILASSAMRAEPIATIVARLRCQYFPTSRDIRRFIDRCIVPVGSEMLDFPRRLSVTYAADISRSKFVQLSRARSR
jgi:hypothetical protein